MPDISLLKERLREDIFNTYESGIKLPEGIVAFYDQRKDCFVDGANLHRLQGATAQDAALLYADLSSDQQLHNRSYLTFCTIYSDLDGGWRNRASPSFNYAAQPAKTQGPEHASSIVRRVLASIMPPMLKG